MNTEKAIAASFRYLYDGSDSGSWYETNFPHERAVL